MGLRMVKWQLGCFESIISEIVISIISGLETVLKFFSLPPSFCSHDFIGEFSTSYRELSRGQSQFNVYEVSCWECVGISLHVQKC